MKRSLSEKTSSNRVQPSPSSVLPASDTEYAKHLVREQLARWRGEHRAHAKRVGRDRCCGGVGSWAAVMIARSGVALIRLIDFD